MRLLVLGSTRMDTFKLPSVGAITVGSSPECPVRVDDPSIGERHAQLDVGARITLRDLESGRSTVVGRTRLTPGESVAISPGTVLVLGGVTMVVQSSGASERLRHVRSHDYFEGRVEDECARVDQGGGTFAIARFRCGRSAAALEEAFAECVRPMDVVATYTPEEYEVLFVDVTPEEARAMADAIVERARAVGGESRATVACYPQDARTPESLFAAASGKRDRASIPPSALGGSAMGRLAALVERVAASHVAVLIVGETGVGKDVMAHTIHRNSSRASKPLLCINCAAVSETLLESELFGYERGAFTGAVQSKAGLLETAEGGTVLLDEVGDMPLAAQAKLLRVLEQKQVTRLGALSPRTIDVRFLAATNRDLEAQIERGAFRRDLYFRLNGFTLAIPPLRERVDEIPDLARTFVKRACAAASRPRAPRLSLQVIASLQQYTWPGNVRELHNVMERAVLLCSGDVLELAHLPLDKMGRTLPPQSLAFASGSIAPPQSGERTSGGSWRPPAPDEDERAKVIRALELCAWNQTKAAALLGISRRTLISRLERFQLPRPKKQT